MGKQILVSPEVLRKSAQGLAAAKEELTYLIEALEQVQTALPGCWESPNTQRYMEKLERVLQSARRNCNSLEDIRKELRQTADDAEAAGGHQDAVGDAETEKARQHRHRHRERRAQRPGKAALRLLQGSSPPPYLFGMISVMKGSIRRSVRKVNAAPGHKNPPPLGIFYALSPSFPPEGGRRSLRSQFVVDFPGTSG